MSEHRQIGEIKLRWLHALARSQEALAVMLENAAQVSGVSDMTAAALREHVRVLTGMQSAILKSVTGVTWRESVNGTPGRPWLARDVGSSRREAHSRETQTEGDPDCSSDWRKKAPPQAAKVRHGSRRFAHSFQSVQGATQTAKKEGVATAEKKRRDRSGRF